jgi:SAM-dependent methyltransferase
MSSSSGADRSATPNTYFLDPESPEEMARLINLDRITTQAMGGPLSGLTEQQIAGLRNVLDLGCGPGGWVLDVAFAYPEIEVAGVDISKIMVDYANARARSQELTNASFGVMDITGPLDFPDGAFDLVNWRFLVGALRSASWPPFVAEAMRVLHPGGILRMTEMVDGGVTNSPAFERLMDAFGEALHRAGYGFPMQRRMFDMTPVLPHLLRKAGYQQIRYRAHALEFSIGTEAWADFYHNTEVAYFLVQPLIVKTGVMSQEEIAQLYHQTLAQWQQPDFCGMWHSMTIWGTRP